MEKLKRDAWDSMFKKEGKIFATPQEDIPKIIKLFKKYNAKRVLDLGCGSGRHLIYLAKHNFDVFGIDISKNGVRIAKKWLGKEGLKANLQVGNIYKKLPYESNFFDAIISTQTLHHGKIEEIRKLIKEMERVLKPNGIIFITVRKHVPKRLISKERLYGIKYIAPRTYVILGGDEKSLPHYRFNKRLLRNEFKKFKILGLWVEQSKKHYCLLGMLKK